MLIFGSVQHTCGVEKKNPQINRHTQSVLDTLKLFIISNIEFLSLFENILHVFTNTRILSAIIQLFGHCLATPHLVPISFSLQETGALHITW